MTRYACCDERRIEAVRATGLGNGIEYLEVVDGPEVPDADRQRLLRIFFVNPPSAGLLAIQDDQVRIDGGERIRDIAVVPPLTFDGAVLVVRVERPGDFSRYTLTIGEADGAPVADLDPRLSSVEFSFKIECPNPFDCATECTCAAEPIAAPEIDYLALDYTSLRRLMLDRMSITAPGWTERNPADLGVALVEVLAYAADHLAYRLDATSTEATLGTARLRSSVRRHARLVDYLIDDGANARAWVHVEVEEGAGSLILPAHTQLLTRVTGLPRILVDPSPEYIEAVAAGPVFFETMEERELRDSLNRFSLYAWGDRDCCLPSGATSATLLGHHPDLHAGSVLILAERLGPRSGAEADADPAHRHAVRLTAEPTQGSDPLGTWFAHPDQPPGPVDVTEIRWGPGDALPFELCVSATALDGTFHPEVSHVLGNIVLADHGRSRVEELPEVPGPDPRLRLPQEGGRCPPSRDLARAARFAPRLAERGLTMAGTIGVPLPDGDPRRPARFDPAASASAAVTWQPRHVLPDLTLADPDTGDLWVPRRDLLASDGFAAEFVAETEDDGRATLRFGDGRHGRRPRQGSAFLARYRTGNGSGGAIGAGALWHVVTTVGGIASIDNPLPATGASDPESVDRVRRDAPVAFRVPERAVTPDDYAEVAQRHPEVARAVCRERWMGSWYTMFLSIDRRDGLPVDRAFEDLLRAHLERFRMAGHDLEITPPRFVAIELTLRVCVLPHYHRADVERVVGSVLGRGRSGDGRAQFFHPDNLSFATPVHLSAILAAVQAVEGVRMVRATRFRRLGLPASSALGSGVLTFSDLEIPRLDNDPNFAERGTLTLEMEGGR